MIIAKRLKGKAIAAWLGPGGEAARRAVASIKGQWQKAGNRLDVYIDPADPWSYLAMQVAQRLECPRGYSGYLIEQWGREEKRCDAFVTDRIREFRRLQHRVLSEHHEARAV